MAFSKKLLLGFLLGFAGLVGIFVYGLFWSTPPQEIPSPLVGKPAPTFHFQTLPNQKKMELGSFLGKPVVINFWASWCIPCVQEAAVLQKVFEQYSSPRLQIFALAISDSSAAVLNFQKQYRLSYPLGLDFENKISLDYGVTGVPETFLLDRQGKIFKKITGALTEEDVEKYLKNF